MPANLKIKPNNKRNQAGLTSVVANTSDIYNVWQALGGKGVWADEWPKLIDPQQTPIQSVKIKKVVVRAGGAIDGIQFFYTIETKDGKKYEVDGAKIGGNGGTEYTLNFGEDEYLLKMRGTYNNSSLTFIEFFSYNTTTKNVNPSQWYGSSGGTWFTVSIPTFTGNNRTSGNMVAGFDFFEGDVVDENENKINKWENALWGNKDPVNVKEWWNSISAEWNKDFSEFGTAINADAFLKVKGRLDQLNKRPDITQADYQKLKENQENPQHSDYEQIKKVLKTWTDTFGDKKPNAIKEQLESIDTLTTNLNNLSNLLTDIHDHYVSIGLNKFGEKIDKESLTKIKEELDKIPTLTNINNVVIETNTRLEKEVQDKDEWEKTVTERNKTITLLNTDEKVKNLEETLKTKNQTITERDETIESLRKQIKLLEANQVQTPQIVTVEIPK